MSAYWNPMPSARQLIETTTRNVFSGVWAERNWRNVPGPFYGAATDSMALGCSEAPGHIVFDDDFGGGFGREFIYRQPVNVGEVEAVVNVASIETYSGYGWDGDDHWSADEVRDWWRDRERVRVWAVELATDWGSDPYPKYLGHYRDAANALRDYVAYIDNGLRDYLRGYMFWLNEHREPDDGETLPQL